MKVRVEWDFGDTEFEDMPYEEAVEKADLPKVIEIPVDVAYEDDEGISDWISEEYGFTLLDWWSA